MMFLPERIGRLLKEIGEHRYPFEEKIHSYKMLRSDRKIDDVAGLDTSGWEELPDEQLWGGHREYFWFETAVSIPLKFDGRCVVYRLNTGREGLWDATNPQFSLYVNGRLVQGLDVNHTEALLTEKAGAGDRFRIVLSAFSGDQNFSLRLDSGFRALDRVAEKFYYDCKVPYDTAMLLPEDSAERVAILMTVNEALNLVDLRRPGSSRYRESLVQAQEYLDREFYEKRCGPGRGGANESQVFCVGHTHIDVAWLWTISVTRDKAVRSFSTVLELMRRYPEYTFMSSQPQLYKYVRENAPEVYAEIKKRVAEGRWEVEGGMWVEADCNLASGEALVRQFLYGKRFFREEFGKDCEILWLPDVFGYSAALPQIMEQCGIKYFMTSKISWNEVNQMPYDTFLWEGIDGTRVLTHFLCVRDVGGTATNEGHADFFTTYNGYLAPSQVIGAWKRYQQKHLNGEVLMAFGYGDGGGGPTSEQLENYRRLERGIPGSPCAKMSTSREFFQTLEQSVSDSRRLPAWVGELYLEYHRGTYTSMARNKKYNRRAEFTYQNAELYGVVAGLLTEAVYPHQDILDGWEIILLNQFHDILPGSSIQEVYEESKAQYEDILGTGDELIQGALYGIAERVDAPRHALVAYNPNSACSDQVIAFPWPKGVASPVVYDGDTMLETQLTTGGEVLFTAGGVPSKGYKAFRLRDEAGGHEPDMDITAARMENGFFLLELDDHGRFTRIYDKRAGRELLPEGQLGNVLMTYEDKPHNYDAWDINNYYTEKSWEVAEIRSIEVVERGPVRAALKIRRPYLNSEITQYIRIYKHVPRIDIYNEIDWKETQVLLRALLPVDIHASEATFDIQYGNVKRPTHANTSWDFARFEVCAHKWLDLSEDGYGVSVLNDCKYGFSVRDGVIGVSLLKSASYPNPAADKERHSFTYSIYPHEGGWREAGTVDQAYHLNNPMSTALKENDGGALPGNWSLLSVDRENVVIEAVKKAEESDDLIVRLYECWGRRTSAELTFASEPESVEQCGMLEEKGAPLPVRGAVLPITIKPYEIKTFKVKLRDSMTDQGGKQND